MSLYEDLINSKPLFESNEEALKFYTEKYEALGAKHGMTGDQYWMLAEHASKFEEDHWEILGLARRIAVAKHFAKETKSG